MKDYFHPHFLACSLLIALWLPAPAQTQSPLLSSYPQYQSMKARSSFHQEWVPLGPTVNSARADIVQVDPTQPWVMYAGFGSGGLWKTTNHGASWKQVFDGQAALGLGDVELAPSNSSIVYAGTGENLKKPRNFTLPGTGMYRSDDAGETWRHLGLEDSWSIAEIAIHPTNPNIVFAGVLGHLWTPNTNRGLYRSLNGGQSWEHVLFRNDRTGVNDVVIAPSQPEIVYASTWEVHPGISGNTSGVHRSMDGGKTWELASKGLPTGPKLGRIGLAVSHQNPNKVYALVDNLALKRDDTAELYVTLDGGKNWKKTHEAPFQLWPGIGWYFTDVYVNPQDDKEVYCLGVRLAHSNDGGKTFDFVGGNINHVTPSRAQGLHLDQCELWIDPGNPQHLALGNDGGYYVSYDRGASWTHYNNIPTGEFYDITIDQSTYTIYGGTQDDATVYGPARELNTRFNDPWQYLWIDPWDGGDGCVTQVDPVDPNTLYYSRQHGDALRLDRKNDSVKSIMPAFPKGSADTARFNYMSNYFISKYDHRTLYHGGNFLFKSTDRGDTWKAISPNLALRPAQKGKKSTAIGAVAESPLKQGLLYAGTDNGAFWMTLDDGAHWQEFSEGLTNHYIRSICPSRHVAGRVYTCMTGLNHDDLHAYIYVSEDHGKNWKPIHAGLPDEPVNVVLEDPVDPQILYAGGARGMYVSVDRGTSWELMGSMPQASVADMEIHEPTNDLVVATHGRGIFRTNLIPVRQFSALRQRNAVALLDVPVATLPYRNSNGGEVDYRTAEKVPLNFWLPSQQDVTFTLVDTAGKEVWKTSVTGLQGLNEYRWDLVCKRVTSGYAYFIHYDQFLKPGQYVLKLSTGAQTVEKKFTAVQGASPYTLK